VQGGRVFEPHEIAWVGREDLRPHPALEIVNHVEDAKVGELLAFAWTWASGLLTHKVVLVSVGGAVGTCARYFVSTWVGAPSWAQGFPVGTFVINVSGSLVLGVAAVIIRQRLPPEFGYWYLLVGTGFCGGYTTFSTFEYDSRGRKEVPS
jgi:protein CrcB